MMKIVKFWEFFSIYNLHTSFQDLRRSAWVANNYLFEVKKNALLLVSLAVHKIFQKRQKFVTT